MFEHPTRYDLISDKKADPKLKSQNENREQTQLHKLEILLYAVVLKVIVTLNCDRSLKAYAVLFIPVRKTYLLLNRNSNADISDKWGPRQNVFICRRYL